MMCDADDGDGDDSSSLSQLFRAWWLSLLTVLTFSSFAFRFLIRLALLSFLTMLTLSSFAFRFLNRYTFLSFLTVLTFSFALRFVLISHNCWFRLRDGFVHC